MRTKYIVYDTVLCPSAVVFPEMIGHDDMARALNIKLEDVWGAGFCYINENASWTCYDRSASLRVASRGAEDERLLNKYCGGPQTYE